MRIVSALILVISYLMPFEMAAQSVINGGFSSGGTSWGCNPEVNPESTYGGTSNTNLVAEVDAQAGLCQTITGLQVGAYYQLTFRCSRRTTCGPTLQSMQVTMSNGVMNSSISRNGTSFAWVTETIDFFPTSTSHVLTFTGTTTATCNLVVDDIQIILVSPLPVELSAFDASCSNQNVVLNWTTESEIRTDYFAIDHSTDGVSWGEIAQVKAQFNTQSRTDYSYELGNSQSEFSYYRLRLKNMDGLEEVLSVISVNCENEHIMIYPNPTKGIVKVTAPVSQFVGIFDSFGRKVFESVRTISKEQFEVDLSEFSAGLYYLQVGDKRHKLIKE